MDTIRGRSRNLYWRPSAKGTLKLVDCIRDTSDMDQQSIVFWSALRHIHRNDIQYCRDTALHRTGALFISVLVCVNANSCYHYIDSADP